MSSIGTKSMRDEEKMVDIVDILREIEDAKVKVKMTINNWENVLDELDRRAKEYEEILRTYEEEEAQLKSSIAKVDSIIKLNVRGTAFEVCKDLVGNGKSLYFNKMLSSSIALGDNGEYFIDRNSHCFDIILEYMRTGELYTKVLNSYDKDCLYDNLDYFKIAHTPRWNFSKVTHVDNIKLKVFLQLKDGRLCGSDNDHKICIYNMDTNAIETTMEGHTKGFEAIFQLEDGRICSCPFGTTIKLWNIESGQCDLNIAGHNYLIKCTIQLINGRLCSGNADNTLKIWNTDTGVCEQSLHTGGYVICIVQLRNGSICSGDYNGNIKSWNITRGVCEMTLTGHTSCINTIVTIDDIRICSCSDDATIKVWNISTGVCERTLEAHKSSIREMVLLLNGKICSVSAGGFAKVWNVEAGVCELTVQVCSKSLIKVVQLQDDRLVVSNSNKDVYILG